MQVYKEDNLKIRDC